MDKPTVADWLKEMRQSFIGVPVPGLGIMDFSQEQFQMLEDGFRGKFKGGAPYPVKIFVGFVLGETIVRNIKGATWVNLGCTELSDAEIEIKPKDPNMSRFVAKPVLRAGKFFRDNEDGLNALFELCELHTLYTMEECMTIGTPIGDGWYKLPSGMVFRMLQREDNKDLLTPIKETDKPVELIDGKLVEQKMQSKYRPGYEAEKN